MPIMAPVLNTDFVASVVGIIVGAGKGTELGVAVGD
jgi:hypothetical protein